MTAGMTASVTEQVRLEVEKEWSRLASERELLRRVYAPELSLDVLTLSDLMNSALDERMDAGLLGNAKGVAHRVRCTAATCGFPNVSVSAARIEETLQAVLRGHAPADAWFVVLRALREMREELQAVEEAREVSVPTTEPEIPQPIPRDPSVEEALASLAADDVSEETWGVVERALGELGSLGARAVEVAGEGTGALPKDPAEGSAVEPAPAP